MKCIEIILDIHAYAEEKLCDECFDDPPYYGINGPEVMLPFAEGRGHKFLFEFNDSTTLFDLVSKIKAELGCQEESWYAETFFVFDENRYQFYEDKSLLFNNIVAKYYSGKNVVTVGLYISCDAGEVWNEHPLRYYVHSREAGRHHEPHVHVSDCGHRYEASVSIVNGEMLEGDMPKKYLKLAKKVILENQSYFFDCWNKLTDGLFADINHYMGYISY